MIMYKGTIHIKNKTKHTYTHMKAINTKLTGTEVELFINGNTESCRVVIQVSDSKKKSLQSVKSKDKDKYELAHLKGDTEAMEVIRTKVVNAYRELVEDALRGIFSGLKIKYSEANELLKFPGAEREWIEVDFTEKKSEKKTK